MKNNVKSTYITIIAILTITNILFIGLYINEKTKKSNSGDINNIEKSSIVMKYAGIYHTNNYQNKYEDTMTFSEDMTCHHGNSIQECVWKLKNEKTIEYTTTWYHAWVDQEKIPLENLPTMEKCEQYLNNLDDTNYTNKRCEKYVTPTQEAIIVNNGILIDNTLYNKIG